MAVRAGVGRGTVSRVINNAAGVKASTRRAVQRAVEELGYVPNLAARSLAGRRADAVALVLTEPDWRQFAEPFFSEIVRSLGDALADTGMQLLLTLVRSDAERQRFLEYARGGRVDGALLVSVHAGDPLPDMLAEARLPTVMLGRRSGDEHVSYVDADNVGGARSAVAHLLKRGRREIATITGPLDMYVAQCRLRGYREAMATAGQGASGPGSPRATSRRRAGAVPWLNSSNGIRRSTGSSPRRTPRRWVLCRRCARRDGVCPRTSP